MQSFKTTRQELIQFTDNLIRNNADYTREGLQVDFDKIHYSDKETFLGYILKAHEDPWEWLCESDNRDSLASVFSQVLLKGDAESRYDFISNMTDEAISYHENQMRELINERVGWVEDSDNYDRGLKPIHDSNTGEVRWIRSSS